MFFRDDSFYPIVRRKNFNIIDWFSSIGGILGLFFGFSFLSAFEVMFHIWKGFFERNRANVIDLSRISYSKWRKLKSIISIWEYLKNYLRQSSIHGLSYVSDGNMRVVER